MSDTETSRSESLAAALGRIPSGLFVLTFCTAFNSSTPPVMVTAPVYELLPLRNNVPGPALVRPLAWR